MPVVFISYKSPDLASAERICSALESRGIACWMAPRDIPPGADWPSAVVHGIKGAKVMVLVLSAASHSDKQIAREVENADHEGLSIVTFRLDNVSPPDQLAYFLRNLQWLDAFDGRFDAAVERLVKVVLAPSAPPPSPASTGLAQTRTTNRTMPLLWSAIGTVVLALAVWAMVAYRNPQPAAAKQNSAAASAGNAQTTSPPIPLEGQSNADVAQSVPPPSSLNRAELIQLRNAARREWRNGKQVKAIDDISRLITLDPHWAAPYLDRGEWELARGQNNEALSDFKACIDAHPDSLAIEQIAYQHRGELEQTMGNTDGAKADLAEAETIKSKMGSSKGK
jgi:tetratricopeptide (TPR) repeat protein